MAAASPTHNASGGRSGVKRKATREQVVALVGDDATALAAQRLAADIDEVVQSLRQRPELVLPTLAFIRSGHAAPSKKDEFPRGVRTARD
eukprot:4415007-Alexandrium_andersonii.AAC.1